MIFLWLIIYKNIPEKIPDEIFEKILEYKNVRIERIISNGQASAKDFWYDQDENEWVILLKGSAEILFEEQSEKIFLKEGDYINITAHIKHRVEYTDQNVETIWLAIFY